MKYFSYFSQQSDFDVLVHCHSLFSEKSKKNIISLSSAEFALRAVKIKERLVHSFYKNILCLNANSVVPLMLRYEQADLGKHYLH